MKLKTIPLVIAAILPMTSIAATHTLDGTSLTVDKLWEISKSGEDVNISKEGWERIRASYKAPIDAAEDGRSIYGLTVNYGALKDQRVVLNFEEGTVTVAPSRSTVTRVGLG